MKTMARLLMRAGVPQRTLVLILFRVFAMRAAVQAELQALRWYAIITAYQAIDATGAHAAAEWFARVSGLRARLKAALGYGDELDR